MFGAIRSQTGSSPNEFKFTGEQVDGTGLQYLRARYYDQATGRFLTHDPLSGWAQRPQTQNPYPYVTNNPLNLRDPYGLCGLCDWVDDNVVDPIDDNIVDPLGEGAQQVGHGIGNLSLDDLGYVDINGTACYGVCITGGVQFGFGQGFHPYGGGGIGSPQFGGSVQIAPGQKITTGWSCAFQASAGIPGTRWSLTGQVGGSGIAVDKEGKGSWSPFGEIGVGYGFSSHAIAWADTCVYIL